MAHHHDFGIHLDDNDDSSGKSPARGQPYNNNNKLPPVPHQLWVNHGVQILAGQVEHDNNDTMTMTTTTAMTTTATATTTTTVHHDHYPPQLHDDIDDGGGSNDASTQRRQGGGGGELAWVKRQRQGDVACDMGIVGISRAT
ncbi:hypothetical protein EDB89DRAFT_1904737 [Lactarius sanguifluus]|nr:hypothetical protein EDB89DRAFT_1904737 [Lactarius sanguifluus]